MRVWLLYKRNFSELLPGDHGVIRLLEEAKHLNITVNVYRPNQFKVFNPLIVTNSLQVDGVLEPLPDLIIPRVGAESSHFLLLLLRQFEMMGIRVCNSYEGIFTVKDKMRLSQLLTFHGLPTPKTALLDYPFDEEWIEQTFDFPVVMKPISGARGFGVTLCHDIHQCRDFIELLSLNSHDLKVIIQEFVSKQIGVDLRVFVLGERVVSCMKRTAAQGFKANYSLGGKVSAYPITEEVAFLARAATQCCRLEIAGVDLLFSDTGFTICEVNSSPGFKGMELATRQNIAREIWNYFLSTTPHS